MAGSPDALPRPRIRERPEHRCSLRHGDAEVSRAAPETPGARPLRASPTWSLARSRQRESESATRTRTDAFFSSDMGVSRTSWATSAECAPFRVVSPQLHEVLIEGGAMTNHVRMGIYTITKGTYDELIERARGGLAPILRDSPGFVFYSTTDVGGGRFVSVSTWQTREQAEAAGAKSAEWVSENMADSVALEENLIGEMTTLAATERSAV